MTERRGSTGRLVEWWRRVVDHFRWDDASGAELGGGRGPVPPALTPVTGAHANAHHVSLDQLLERVADRRAQRGAGG